MSAPQDMTGIPAGYAVPWVVAPGQAVALHASLPRATRVDVVRLACLNAERDPDGRPFGPAESISAVPAALSGIHGPAVQPLLAGAQVGAVCARLPLWRDGSLVLALQRMARGAPGHVMSLLDAQGSGIVIELDAPRGSVAMLGVAVQPGGDSLRIALPDGEWLLLVLDLLPDPDRPGQAVLQARTARCCAVVPDGVSGAWDTWHQQSCAMPGGRPSHWYLGTRPGHRASADVRLDLLSVVPRASVQGLSPAGLLTCEDDGGAGPSAPWERMALGATDGACLLRARLGKGASVQDLARGARLHEPQRPYTAVRGVRWDGRFQDPQRAPAHYSALHFNADTLLDAHWVPTTSWRVPDDLDSGSYAFRLHAVDEPGAEPVYVSFFVSGATRPRHRVAVLLPTFTYLAYANAPEDMRGPVISGAEHVAERRLDALHPAHGRSIYERHADGQGVLWAGSRRPLWSVSPGHRPWGLVADSWLMDWLQAQGQAFDVITDHDLHRLGEAALAPYRVVLTGHHPEYTSTAMWDGLWRYLHGGGRLLYLGGNGFYWRTACDEEAEMIEVRRAEDGTRPSIGAPGEYHCAFTGEYGGLWRRLGRAPQQIVGVGMAAQGFERAAHYRKCADAPAPEMAFVFAGVDAGTFGRSGWWGGGASGWEIDRSDADLGTPASTWWLARSEGHAASMLRTKEELLSYIPPFEDRKARSDVVLAPVGQGDVFAVGSMTWIGSLHGDGREPTDVARITANVIRRFLDPLPLPRKATLER